MDKSHPGPLEIHRGCVDASWIDYNGHMSEGYYAVAFGDATDAYLAHAGFSQRYRRDNAATFYTVETHIRYLRELKLGDPIVVRTTVLGVDARKVHLHHSLVHAQAGFEAATQEAFLLHVAKDAVAVTPMGEALLSAIEHDRDNHAALAPDGVGRAIRTIGAER